MQARTVYGDVEGATLADWPLTLHELEPWYRRGGAAPWRSGNPRHSATSPQRQLPGIECCGRALCGYTRFTNSHIAINSASRDGRPACLQMGFCNQGCKISAKWSTLASEIPRAEATGRLDLRTGAQAVRIELDKRGHIEAVSTWIVKATSIGSAPGGFSWPATPSKRHVCYCSYPTAPRFQRGSATHTGTWAGTICATSTRLAFARMPGPVNMHRGIVTPGTVFDEDRHDASRGFRRRLSYGGPWPGADFPGDAGGRQ